MSENNLPKTILFYWENIGPTHNDRLQALSRELGDEWRIVVVERSSKSLVYDWENAAQGEYLTRTLFDRAESVQNWRFAWNLWRAIADAKPDAAFFCDYHLWPVMLNAWWLRVTRRSIFIMLDSKFDDFPRNLIRELSKRPYFLPYNGAITASCRSRDYLRIHGIPESRVEFGYDTISVDRIRELAGDLVTTAPIAYTERDFVVVARLVPKKNLDLALEAYRDWVDMTHGTRKLHLCGSGPLEDALRAKCQELKISDRVVFHGFLQSDQISSILSRSLCLLLPSTEEQFGLVVNEALAVGLPVIVSTAAGSCDVLVRPGINGFICQPRDPECWAALMAMLSEDEALWRTMALSAYEGSPRGDTSHFVGGVFRLLGLTSPNGH